MARVIRGSGLAVCVPTDSRDRRYLRLATRPAPLIQFETATGGALVTEALPGACVPRGSALYPAATGGSPGAAETTCYPLVLLGEWLADHAGRGAGAGGVCGSRAGRTPAAHPARRGGGRARGASAGHPGRRPRP